MKQIYEQIEVKALLLFLLKKLNKKSKMVVRSRWMLNVLLFLHIVWIIVAVILQCAGINYPSVIDVVTTIVLVVLEMIWSTLLIINFTGTQHALLKDPQAHLYIFMFLTNLLRDIFYMILLNFKETNLQYIFKLGRMPSMIFYGIFTFGFFLIIVCRFVLSCMRRQVVSYVLKYITAILLLVLCIGTFLLTEEFNETLTAPYIYVGVYGLTDFLLIGYSSRSHEANPNHVQYMTLWFIALFYPAFQLPFLFHVEDDTATYTNMTIDIVFIIQIFGSSLLPLIILFIDKNMRHTLLKHFFPLRRVINERHDGNGNNVEYRDLEPEQHKDDLRQPLVHENVIRSPAYASINEDVRKAPQLAESSFSQQSVLNQSSNGIEDIVTKAPHYIPDNTS